MPAVSESPAGVVRAAHAGPVYTLGFNRTGQYVLSGGHDRQIRLWNSTTRSLVQTYKMHAHEVRDVQVTADSARFASGGGDRTVYLWDVRTSKATSRFTGHVAAVNSLKFAGGNNAVLASASHDGTVKLWDLRNNNTSRPIQTLADARDSVLAVDMQGHLLVTASADGRLRTYDLRRGQLATDPVDNARAAVTAATILHDGDAVLVSTLASRLYLFDLQATTGTTEVPLQVFTGHRNEEYRARPALAQNETLVLAPSEDGRVYVWDMLEELPVQTVPAVPAELESGGSTGSGSKKTGGAFAVAAGPDRAWVSSTPAGDLVFW